MVSGPVKDYSHPFLMLHSLIIGAETKNVQESVVIMEDESGKPFEVHLIDTPGFDDDFDSDTVVLEKIAGWGNSLFGDGKTISGVLYLHDVSVSRMRGSGIRNLEVLPAFIGEEKLQFLTLVTTHWNTLKDSNKEVNNEKSLMTEEKYWRKLLDGDSRANTRRFDNTDGSALEIIREHLQHEFVTRLTHEMVDESMLLGETSAGRIVDKNLDLAYQQALKMAARDPGAIAALEKRLELVKRRLRTKFDKERQLEFLLEMERMKSKQRIFRTIRWVLRLSTVACVSTAIVLTGGVAAPTAGAVPLVEAWAQVWSAHDKDKREKAISNHKSSYDRELADYYGKEELEDGEIADINSLFSCDTLDKS